jgi:ATPase subunit of ABC transporter with duplicated ATPase domains
LLILDEPTNHLDIANVSQTEPSLRAYKGALIVISHDEYFLQQIGIEKYITSLQ